MIKFKICFLKPRLGSNISQSYAIMHMGYSQIWLAEIYLESDLDFPIQTGF